VNSTSALQIQNAAGTSNLLIADTTNTRVGIGKAPTLGVLDVNGAIYQSGNQVCDTSGNCPSSGVGGSGTAGTVPVFTGIGNTIGDSIITQSGAVATVTNTLNATSNLQTNGTTRIDSSGNLSNIGNLSLSGTISGGTTITGTTLNGTTGINSGAGGGTQRIDSSGNLVNIGNLTTSGASTFLTTGANGFTFKPGTDNTAAFQVQNAANSKSVMAVDTTNGQVILGNAGASGVTGQIKFNFAGVAGSTTLAPLTPGGSNFTLN